MYSPVFVQLRTYDSHAKTSRELPILCPGGNVNSAIELLAMEQQQTSKVTVEYHDPHDVYKLLAPGLVPRLPLHNLHWQSHAGPLRSIHTLHVDLVRAGDDETPQATPTPSERRSDSTARDDGFQTQAVGGRTASLETTESSSIAPSISGGQQRRHQIPGLRRTPYLKVLLVRCDDNDSYKSTVRSEVREWIKANTTPSSKSKKSSNSQEKHDAFEWLVLHVIIPNTAAATQPRSSSTKSESGSTEGKGSSRWRSGSTPLMEKLKSDFNSSAKGSPDRIAQIRIGINDVPYDMLPRVVPAVPTGYTETEQDAEQAWSDLVSKFKGLILSSFDQRVSQYEDDIKENDSRRSFPGWNFCTFFILKEGLARGFENVGLVEDALVGYDELSVGLDSVLEEQAQEGSPERHGGALLSYTEELKKTTQSILASALGEDGDEEAVDMQSRDTSKEQSDEIPISATKKAYRDLILANNVSVLDFRCYIFARQIALLLRLGNAQSTREELLAKLKEQQESMAHGVAPRAPPPKKKTEETENLSKLAEICRRTLEFIPSVSQVMRQDITAALTLRDEDGQHTSLKPHQEETVDNMIASFAFSVAQQILAQTSTKALPIPPSTLAHLSEGEPKASIPEPKTMMHPARTTSLHIRPSPQTGPPSPNPFAAAGIGRRASIAEGESHGTSFASAGLEDFAARRADLYTLSRSILDGLGKKRAWSNGWSEAPMIEEIDLPQMEDISLDDEEPATKEPPSPKAAPSATGLNSQLLRTAVDNTDDFYRLYEILTDKALRHFGVAGLDHSVRANQSDLAVLKYHLKEYRAAASFFCQTTPHYGENGWNWLELSMLVMYSQCLKELQDKEYLRVALTLLTKACMAEKGWLKKNLSYGVTDQMPDLSSIREVVGGVSELAKLLPSEAKVPLDNFFTDIELRGTPEYQDDKDLCEIKVQLRSLLPGDIRVDSVALRIASIDDGPCKELWFENKAPLVIQRGEDVISLHSKSVVAGNYKIDHLTLCSGNLTLDFDRDHELPVSPSEPIFKRCDVRIYQRADAFDISLKAAKHTRLDKNNSLDLVLSSGWNALQSCEVRVKPATGGLRLLTTDAEFIDSPDTSFAKQPEAGVFYFGPIAAYSSLIVRFPYTTEQDVSVVAVKLEVTYKSSEPEGHPDTFFFAKSESIPIGLAVGVNVQDVFKHNSLFSRFSVSTATTTPLRLLQTELLESDIFESSGGQSPGQPVLVFPKQPATLMHKIRRKPGVQSKKGIGKTMYLKLHYSQLDTEVEALIQLTINKDLSQSELAPLRRDISEIVEDHVRASFEPQDFERAALLGEIPTSFLESIPWKGHYQGLGTIKGTDDDAGSLVAQFFKKWIEEHPRISIPESGAVAASSIVIPVEIPSVSVVHSADIRLADPSPSLPGSYSAVIPTVTVGQVLTATLHLKWTRVWDTTDGLPKEDQEFSYEVTAPSESWLLGGRRKGHFIIPPTPQSSTPELEASIPLVLIPQREGHLSYPTVEIREIGSGGEPILDSTQTEVDTRNIGESIRVVGGRKGVTVSLDASGPGGGPLVVEGSRLVAEGGRVVA